MKRLATVCLGMGLLMLAAPTSALARQSNSEKAGVIAGVVVGLIVVFLLLRELVCWYNKTNEHGALLREIRDELRALRVGGGHSLPEPDKEEHPYPTVDDDESKPVEPDAWS